MLFRHLSDSLTFFKSHFVYLAMIILPFTIPVGIFDLIYQSLFVTDINDLKQQLAPMAVSLVVYPIYQTAVVVAISAVLENSYPSLTTLWSRGLKLWLPVVAVNFLYLSAVAGGFLLFVLPGLFFTIRFMFAEFFVIFDGQHPLDAMRSSWVASKNYFGTLLGGFIIISLVVYLPFLVVQSTLANLGIHPIISQLLPSLVLSILATFYTIFTFRVFYFARTQK